MKTLFSIPRRVQHGLLLATYLAERSTERRPIPLEEVARNEGISQGFLEEIAAFLRSSGIIAGRRGVGGGYVLAKQPHEVTVADVIAAIEGRGWAEHCLGESAEAPIRNGRNIWQKVQGQVMATLYNVTLADVVAEHVAPSAK